MTTQLNMLGKLLAINVNRGLLVICCAISFISESQAKTNAALQSRGVLPGDSIIYTSANLVIHRLSEHICEHISFLKTNDFGKVDCNGMIVINGKEAIVFDTPADDTSAAELIQYLRTSGITIKALIATHFHEDCIGGLQSFYKNAIPCYAFYKTISIMKEKGNKKYSMLKGFRNNLTLNMGDKKVYAEYIGEGHTKDNVVGYFPDESTVFGGCLVKAVGAGKGNLADANVVAWPATVQQLKQKYPRAQIVIPGHGKWGGVELFDYTVKLFE